MTYLKLIHPLAYRRHMKRCNAPWNPPLAYAPPVIPDPQGRRPLPASAWGYESAKVAANS